MFAVAVGLAMTIIADPVWAQTTAINETGSGTASTSPDNCQNTGNRVCTTSVQGSVIGNPIANPSTTQGIVGTFTADYDDAVVTGFTFTVPATGEVTLTDADGSRLFLSTVGNLSGPVTPAGATLTFDGTFEVIGGTGEFNGATGEGDTAVTLTGSGTSSETFTASLSGTLTTQQPADEDLTITKDASKDSVRVGQILRYILVVENHSSTTQDVVLEDDLPNKVRFLGTSTSDANVSCVEDDGSVRCLINNLNPGESAEVTIVVRARRKGIVENTAQIFSAAAPSDRVDEDTASTRIRKR
jgi:uncharacterized repeat protein (TIGR01451 family)